MEGGKKGGTNSRNLGGKFFSSAGNISFPALFRFRSSQLTGKGRGFLTFFHLYLLFYVKETSSPFYKRGQALQQGAQE
jgi:hypothetical protein